jgi:c-di-GMP-binding flagellar brake protein YcgR
MKESAEKRLSKRLSAPVSIEYTLPDGSSNKIVAKNISITGICLLLPQKISIGIKLVITILMPRGNRNTVIHGEVMWQEKAERGYITGIHFTQADPLDIEKIISSVKTGQYFILR